MHMKLFIQNNPSEVFGHAGIADAAKLIFVFINSCHFAVQSMVHQMAQFGWILVKGRRPVDFSIPVDEPEPWIFTELQSHLSENIQMVHFDLSLIHI